MVSVRYNCYNAFVVPNGIDLNSDKVEDWYVRWDTLYITLKNGKQYEINGEMDASNGENFKYPDETSVEKNEVYDYVSDSEDEEKESWGEKCKCGFEIKFNNEEEFDEAPERLVGYGRDGKWFCEECRKKNDDVQPLQETANENP